MNKKELPAKVTAICWLTNIIATFKVASYHGRMVWMEQEIYELSEILRYIKVAPAHKPKRAQSTLSLLKEVQNTLKRLDCQFFACEGYQKKPEDMKTCARCESIWKINQHINPKRKK
jgi:hypothetical protein